MERRNKAIVSAVVLVITLVINYMGAMGMINNLSQKEISDMFPTLITPGPVTFSIWGLIYILLLASVIVMIVKSNESYYSNAIDEISSLFWLSSLLNIGWIIAFSYLQIGLSTLLIFGFVILLVMINQKLRSIQSGAQWLLPLAFGLYGGWLFIATVVNTAAWLVQVEWSRWGIGDSTWGVAILLVALALTFGVLRQHRNAIYPLPIAWAYLGIYQALASTESAAGQPGFMPIIALIGMAVLAGMVIVQFVQNGRTLCPGSFYR